MKQESDKTDLNKKSADVFDKLVEKIFTWAEKGKEEGSYAIKTSKLHMNISSHKLQIEEKMQGIGKKIYEMHNKGEIKITDEELIKIIEEIKSLENKIIRHQKLIKKLREDRHKHSDEKAMDKEKNNPES